MLLSGSLGAFAQDAPAVEGKTLSTVTVREKAEPEEGRDSLRVTRTGVARGTQDLRDIPQSVTVITEKLMDDRNLDTLKQALQYTAGIQRHHQPPRMIRPFILLPAWSSPGPTQNL